MNIPEHMRTKCDRYSRIVGYYAPVSRWNEAKQSEFNDRKLFKVSKDEQLRNEGQRSTV